MWPESGDITGKENPQPLRTGLTTGSCATACCVAAAEWLLSGNCISDVTITLPARKSSSGSAAKQVILIIHSSQPSETGVRVSTIKDAGDDPDVTHGAEIFVELSLLHDQAGIQFHAADGVGTVTRDGLALAPGEPAINPVPRQMMTEHLQVVAQRYDYTGGFRVAVGIVNGEQIAQKTMNPRLGILGGLSVLGTTGIVRPFSCAAYIASIYQGVDVASANGHVHIGASTGNRSEQAIIREYQLSDMALIEMGDFVGALLKYLKQNFEHLKVRKLTICGGFGKISKLAQGHMDLHSRASAIDLDFISQRAGQVGADDRLCKEITEANTSIEAFRLCQSQNIPLADALCADALRTVRSKIPDIIKAEVHAIDRQGNIIGKAGSL